MWNADIFSALSALSFILSTLAAYYCARTATVAQELQEKLRRLPTSRLESLETSHELMQDELRNLTNRVKMMKVRRAADHIRDDDGLLADKARRMPDPYKDPDAWRAAVNSQLARAKIGGN